MNERFERWGGGRKEAKGLGGLRFGGGDGGGGDGEGGGCSRRH